jgi:hypothetical protein
VVVAFRGASKLTKTGTSASTEPWKNANFLEPYGDPFTTDQWKKLLPGGANDNSFTVTEFPTDGDLKWRASPALLNGARYVQMRVSMISNATSGLSPWVSALGLSYLR